MAHRVLIKQGVMGDLRPEARQGFRAVARYYHDKGLDFIVTSIREGTHSPGSMHYTGMAFDFDPQGASEQHIEHVLSFEPGWYVLHEGSHIHAHRTGIPIPSMG